MKSCISTYYFFIFCCIISSCKISDRTDNGISTDIVKNANSLKGKDTSEMPILFLPETKIDLGKVVQGDILTHTFKFVNNGKSDLVLVEIKGTCGCTVFKNWPKTPIAPGEGGTVDIQYDSGNKEGAHDVTVSIVANTSPATTYYSFKIFVVTPDNKNKQSIN
jgi:Protein of unknown function (DUF1573)